MSPHRPREGIGRRGDGSGGLVVALDDVVVLVTAELDLDLLEDTAVHLVAFRCRAAESRDSRRLF